MGMYKEINMKRIVVYVHGKGGSAAQKIVKFCSGEEPDGKVEKRS